jgi:hypothetical protein
MSQIPAIHCRLLEVIGNKTDFGGGLRFLQRNPNIHLVHPWPCLEIRLSIRRSSHYIETNGSIDQRSRPSLPM